MRIKLLAVGTRMPKWVEQGYQEYAQRMPNICKLELLEIAAKKRGKNADTVRILRDEGLQLKAAIPKGALTIALDRKGKDCLLYTSPSPRDRQKSRMPSSA